MFCLTESKREIWFNKDCTWSSNEYCLVGVLVGLAIYNATLLDLHFPLAVYRKLLGLPVSLADLEDIDPELMGGRWLWWCWWCDCVCICMCGSMELVVVLGSVSAK